MFSQLKFFMKVFNPLLLSKILRRLKLARFFDFDVSIDSKAGKLLIPLQRGLSES